MVQHRGAEQCDSRVLGGTDLDLTLQLRWAGDLEVNGALGGREDQGHLERGCQSLDHVERDVLLPHLYPVNGRLRGVDFVGEALLGPLTGLARLPDHDSQGLAGGGHGAILTHI